MSPWRMRVYMMILQMMPQIPFPERPRCINQILYIAQYVPDVPRKVRKASRHVYRSRTNLCSCVRHIPLVVVYPRPPFSPQQSLQSTSDKQVHDSFTHEPSGDSRSDDRSLLCTFRCRRRLETTEKCRPQPSASHA